MIHSGHFCPKFLWKIHICEWIVSCILDEVFTPGGVVGGTQIPQVIFKNFPLVSNFLSIFLLF